MQLHIIHFFVQHILSATLHSVCVCVLKCRNNIWWFGDRSFCLSLALHLILSPQQIFILTSNPTPHYVFRVYVIYCARRLLITSFGCSQNVHNGVFCLCHTTRWICHSNLPNHIYLFNWTASLFIWMIEWCSSIWLNFLISFWSGRENFDLKSKLWHM